MKMGIAGRLIASFATLIFLMLVIASIGIWGLGQLDGMVNTITRETTPKIMLTSNILTEVLMMRRFEKNLAIVTTPAELNKEYERVKQHQTKAMEFMNKLEPQLLIQENKERIAKAKLTLQKLAGLEEQMYRAAATGTAEGRLLAAQITTTSAGEAGNELRQHLDDLNAATAGMLTRDQEDAASLYNTLFWTSSILALAAFALAVGLALVIIRNITGAMQHALGTVAGVAAGSQQLSSSSQQISQGASEQAASVEEISSTLEEMTSTIKQNTANAGQTEKIAQQVAADARRSGDEVTRTVEAMNQIAEKINIVQEIAGQTSLLALNASIEAARAGNQGKGFAVVASEVQKLAERSKIAAAEISELSQGSVETARRAGELILKLVPDIERTAGLVSEINAASIEQNTGTGQVYKAVEQFGSVVQENASAAEELASTAEELSNQAISLRRIVELIMYGKEKAAENGHHVQHAHHTARTTTKAARVEVKRQAEQNGHGTGNGRKGSQGFEYELSNTADALDAEFESVK